MRFSLMPSMFVVAVAVCAARAQTVAERVQPGVVQVIALDERDQPASAGSGFIVLDQDRMFVVTNFHVLRNRKGAIARPAVDESREIRLEPLAALPGRDLAILRPVDPGEMEAAGAAGLKLAGSASVGESAWVIGYPRGLGFSVSQGIVSGHRVFSQLPDRYQSGVIFGDTDLVQTDAAVNSGNSGGPLVNGEGGVIGVSSFVLTDGHGLYLAISSSHVAQAIEHLPSNPIGFDAFESTRTPASAPAGPVGPSNPGMTPDQMPPVEPAPGPDVRRDKPSTLLVSATAGLRRGIICNRCEGTGKVKQKKQTGTERVGPNSTRPVFEMVPVDCTTCRATCVQRPAAVRVQLGRVVESLAEVEEDEKYEERLMALRDMLRERVAPVAEPLHPVLLDWYRDIVRKPQDQQIGEVLVAFGGVEDMIDHETFWIKHSTAGPIVVRDTRLVHTLDHEHVIIAGLITGFEKYRGKDTFVLRHGMVVSY